MEDTEHTGAHDFPQGRAVLSLLAYTCIKQTLLGLALVAVVVRLELEDRLQCLFNIVTQSTKIITQNQILQPADLDWQPSLENL